MTSFDSRSASILVALARQQSGIDADHCAAAVAHLVDAERLRQRLSGVLARYQLSDLQFAILVLLSYNELEPIPMAILATQAGVSRSAVTEAIDALETLRIARRVRDRDDRRLIRAQITASGQAKVNDAIQDYLQVLSKNLLHNEVWVALVSCGKLDPVDL